MNRSIVGRRSRWTWLGHGVVLLAIGGASGCRFLPSGPDERGSVRLEVGAVEATLAAGEALRISTSLKNTSSRPLYLLPCAGTALFRLERREADVWQGIYNPGCDYALRAPVVIQVGATYTDVASIPVDVTLTPGAYRVQLAVYRADVTRISDLATPSEYLIPEAQRTSPSFEVPLQ